MHCCLFCGRAFSRKFNRDRHEAAHCSKRFDDEEGMTSLSNDEESIEQRTEKYYEDDDEENNSTEDGEEVDDHDDDEEEAMVRKKLTMVRQAVTQKMMKLILGIS